MENLSLEGIKKHYHKNLYHFIKNFETQLKCQNKKFKTRHAYIMLIIRDPSKGNIDICSNLETESITYILEEALRSIKEK